MTARLKIPRMLADAVKTDLVHSVEGKTLGEVMGSLLTQTPGLRHHIIDESGAIRPHVSVFVDGTRADLNTNVDEGAEIRILHAVSGG